MASRVRETAVLSEQLIKLDGELMEQLANTDDEHLEEIGSKIESLAEQCLSVSGTPQKAVIFAVGAAAELVCRFYTGEARDLVREKVIDAFRAWPSFRQCQDDENENAVKMPHIQGGRPGAGGRF
jgi:hypothetical protein